MAKVIVTESSLENIADAIRAKLGTQTQYKPNQMASAIGQIHGEPVLETLNATSNGTYYPSSGKDGFSQVSVNVSGGGGGGVVLSGTDAPTSAIGSDENIYVQYKVRSVPPFDHTIAIDGIYRKVNGAWETYTEPAWPTIGAHIWTKSTGGGDAAMYVQNGYWDTDNDQFVATSEVVSVIYTSVRGSNTYNCNNVATLGYPSNWQVYATDNVTDGTNTYSSGDLVKAWAYNASVDFYVYKNV